MSIPVNDDDHPVSSISDDDHPVSSISDDELSVSFADDIMLSDQYDLNAGVVQAEMDPVSDSDRTGSESSSDAANFASAVPSSSSSKFRETTLESFIVDKFRLCVAVVVAADLTTTPTSTTLTPSHPPLPAQNSLGPILSYRLVDFDWTDVSKWEYVNGETVSSDMVTASGIKLTPGNSNEPIRTIEGWSGEKVVFIEWERTSTSDTNIWMLNTKLQSHFGKGNGWPYWGEIDLFEMFKQDARNTPTYDYSGFGGFSDVSSYGQMTMHMGPATENGSPCFCPASPSKNLWYDNTPPMTSGCTAQFSNDLSNSIAAVWGSDSTGKYIQLIQKPTITKGGMLNGVETYDVATGSGGVTSKIYNNAQLFWGVDATDSCAKAGGHDAASGFPFFESFRLILEEQTKGDVSASFTVKNIQIFTKN